MKEDASFPLNGKFQSASAQDGGRRVVCGSEYDLRPALDVIQTEIERRTQGGRPLVVLMGERHDAPAHIALRQSVIERLLTSSSPIACGLEREHDLLGAIVESTFQYPLTGELRDALDVLDPDGQNMLKAYKATRKAVESPVMDKNFISFCLAEEVSVRANDAAASWALAPGGVSKRCLDMADLATCKILQRHAPALQGKDVTFISAEGVYLRNRLIVERVLGHMNDSGAQVYVQSCGNSHIYGDKFGHKHFVQSLSALFNQAGMDVLPVFVSSKAYDEGLIPAGAEAMRQQGVVVSGLSERLFEYKGYGSEFSDEYDESCLIEAISKHSGGAFKIMPDAFMGRGSLLWDEVESLVPAWVDEAEALVKKRPLQPPSP